MTDRINTWLKYKNFAAGIELLNELGIASDFVNKFKGVRTASPTQQNELLHLIQSYDATQKTIPAIVTATTKKEKSISPLHQKSIEVLRERASAHNSMKVAKSDKERYELASKIKDYTAQLDKIYDDIRHYEQHGTIPFASTDKADLMRQGIELMKKKSSLAAQISMAKNDKVKQDLLKIELAEVNAAIKEIEGA